MACGRRTGAFICSFGSEAGWDEVLPDKRQRWVDFQSAGFYLRGSGFGDPVNPCEMGTRIWQKDLACVIMNCVFSLFFT